MLFIACPLSGPYSSYHSIWISSLLSALWQAHIVHTIIHVTKLFIVCPPTTPSDYLLYALIPLHLTIYCMPSHHSIWLFIVCPHTTPSDYCHSIWLFIVCPHTNPSIYCMPAHYSIWLFIVCSHTTPSDYCHSIRLFIVCPHTTPSDYLLYALTPFHLTIYCMPSVKPSGYSMLYSWQAPFHLGKL